MAVLDTLRSAFRRKHAEEQIDAEATLWMLAERHVAGEEITTADLETIIVPGTRTRLQCPKGKSHRNVRQVNTDAEGLACCVCDDCGESWRQEVDNTVIPEGALVFEDFEDAVKAVQQRQADQEKAATIPELQKRQEKLQATQQKAIDAVDAAMQKRDQVLSETGPELASLSQRLQLAETSRQNLLHTCYKPDLKAKQAELQRRIREYSPQERALWSELWGQSRPGRLDSVVCNSDGERCLELLQQVANYSGIIDGAREVFPHLVTSSFRLDAASMEERKAIGSWFDPSSQCFRDAIRTEESRGRKATEFRKSMSRYRQFWKSTFEPKRQQWLAALTEIEQLNEEMDALHQQMMES